MKRIYIVFFWFALSVQMFAQGAQSKFSPEKFDAALQQFITKEACLTPQESAKFFPIYKEMQTKQRALLHRQRTIAKVKPSDNKGCEDAIRKRDETELELKRIQVTYHDKMLTVLSASKLYDVLKAEDRFFRQQMRRWGGHKDGARKDGGHKEGQKK